MNRSEVFNNFTQVIRLMVKAKEAALKDDCETAVQLLNEAIVLCHEIRLFL